MKRSGPPKRRTRLARKTELARKRKSWKGRDLPYYDDPEWQRAYHSVERVRYIQWLACIVPGCKKLPCENAHIETGGTGRKADYTTVVPLCRDHHDAYDNAKETFPREHGIDMAEAARLTEEAWQQWGDE